MTLLLIILGVSSTFASEGSSVAVLFDEEEREDTYTSMFIDSIISRLDYSKRMDFDYYSYNESTSEIKPLRGGNTGFSKKIVAIKPSLYYQDKPEIEISYNKEKEDHEGTIRLVFRIETYLKLIDLASSTVELMDYFLYDNQEDQFAEKQFTFSMKKYFKGTLPKKGTKAYKLMIDKVYKDYLPKIKEFHLKTLRKDQKIPFHLRNSLFSFSDDRLFEISPVEGKSRMSQFMIDAGVEDDIFWLDNVRVIKEVQFGKYTCGEYIGTAIVKKRMNDQSKCGFLLTGGKKLKTAVEESIPVYAARNRSLINTLNSIKRERVRLATDADCLFCNAKTEKVIFDIENIELIERSHDFILNYFIPMYKSEQFIDYDVETVLGLQEGVDYMMRSKSKIITLTDVKTNRVSSIGDNYNNNQMRHFLLEFFEEEMEVLTISKRKKNIAKRLVIYSPYGFEPLDVLNTYSVTEEVVAGKSYDRKEKIGTARIMKRYSDNIVEVSINKNEKLITSILDSGGTISIGYFSGVKN